MTEPPEQVTRRPSASTKVARRYTKPEPNYYYFPGTEQELKTWRRVHKLVRYWIPGVLGIAGYLWYIRDTVVNPSNHQGGVCWDGEGKWSLGALNDQAKKQNEVKNVES